MKTIWKFPFAITDSTSVNVPAGAEVLRVHMQQGAACLWALVDPSMPTTQLRLRVYGTGHPMPDDPGKYLGTLDEVEGYLVFHVFSPDLR